MAAGAAVLYRVLTINPSCLSRLSCPSCLLAEHFCLEPPDLCSFLPRVHWQAGFVAGVRQKRFAVPRPFRRDLRQQQTAVPSLLHDEPVLADLDLFRARDRFERTEQRQLEIELR